MQCHKAENLLHRLHFHSNQYTAPESEKEQRNDIIEMKSVEDQQQDDISIAPDFIEICPENEGDYNEKEMSVEFDGVQYEINQEIFHMKDEELSESDDRIAAYSGEEKEDEEIVSGDTKLQQIKIEIIKGEENIVPISKEETKKRKRFERKKKDNDTSETDQSLDKRYRCEICDAKFTKVQSLKRHVKIHQADQKKKVCPFCGKGFIRADDLTRHIRIHTGERPYACDLCPKRYKQTSELKEHMLTHNKQKTFICSICGKALQTRNGHYVHMRTHLGLKNHICELCGNRYVTSGELNSHIRHIHEKKKPFHCSVESCNRSFGTKSSLEIHERTHTGERPYQCTYCDKRLATQSSLSDHIRIHTGTSRHKCEICNRVLITQQALKKHLLIHEAPSEKEGDYECQNCNKRFSYLKEFEDHMSQQCTEYEQLTGELDDNIEIVDNIEEDGRVDGMYIMEIETV